MTSLNLTQFSVRKKPGMAFGGLLLLTLVVMFIGMHSTERIASSADDIFRLDPMELSVLNAQVNVERFIASGIPLEATNFEQLIVKMESKLKEDLIYLNAPSEIKNIIAIQKTLLDYRSSLNVLVQAQSRRDTARSAMVRSGNEALSSIEELQNNEFRKLAEDKKNNRLLERVQHVSILRQSLLKSRYLVRGYVTQQTEEAAAVANNALSELTEELRIMIASAPKEEQISLYNAITVLAPYQEGYQLFNQGVAETKAAANKLAEYSNTMRSVSALLHQVQLTQRTAVVAAARRSLIQGDFNTESAEKNNCERTC